MGYLGHITSQLSLGVFWQSKTYMDKFDKYRGLFADNGSFDVPSTYGAGLGLRRHAEPRSGTRRHPYRLQRCSRGRQRTVAIVSRPPIRRHRRPGFGWRDVTSIKFGANYRISPAWQVRAGFGYNTQPIPLRSNVSEYPRTRRSCNTI
ncbi:MAG: outer membrane protein transport protein [Rhodospirillales bacterium]